MIHIVWEFEVKPEAIAAFEAHYASDGAWARLFARADGYCGTELLRDVATPLRYLTIDRWETVTDFAQFQSRFAEEYSALDRECEQFTVDERLIGHFEVLSS